MTVDHLLIIFAFFLLLFLFAYWREWQYRHRPYYRKTVRNWEEKPMPATKPIYSVVLIGDTGAVATDGTDSILNLLENWQATANENSRVIFLGDNVYPVGIPPENHRHYTRSVNRLNVQLDLFKNSLGKATFLSGNHDWNKGRPNGFTFLERQEKIVCERLKYPEAYLPSNGCPGPVTEQLAPGILLVVLNTQWWVQHGLKPIGEQYDCSQENPDQVFTDLEKILQENKHQRILIAAHHPVYSNAMHGGKFTVKQHLFPLTAAHKKFYLPLPGAGSIYPLYRRYIGAREDMSHPRYRVLRKNLLRIFKQHNNLIYAAGHDHNLQYFHLKGNHYIVSGAGSKTAFVKKGGKATFTHEHTGFFVIDFYEKATWLRILEPNANGENPEVLRIQIS